MSVSGAEQADGLPLPQRYWAILTIALGIMMSVVDGAIANIALPTIAGDLNAPRDRGSPRRYGASASKCERLMPLGRQTKGSSPSTDAR